MTTPSPTATQNVAPASEQGATATPEKAASVKKTGGQRKTAAARKVSQTPEPQPRRKKPAKAAKKRSGKQSLNKGARILELIGRPKGATLAELLKATGWQAHSVRGFISTAARKHQFTIQSERNESGERVYSRTR